MLIRRQEPLAATRTFRSRFGEGAFGLAIVAMAAGFLGTSTAEAQSDDKLHKHIKELHAKIDALSEQRAELLARVRHLEAKIVAMRDEAAHAKANPKKRPGLVAEEISEVEAVETVEEEAVEEEKTPRTVIKARPPRNRARNQLPLDEPASIVASRPSDQYIFDMVTRALDMQSEIRMADERLMYSRKLEKQAMISSSELEHEVVKLETLRRKHGLIRHLLQTELEAVEGEFKHLKKNAARAPRQQRARLEAQMVRIKGRIHVLKAAL